jgi:RHS repeat-associated protein
MVITDATDFELPGAIPFRFERTYYSKASGWEGALGRGWRHKYDESVVIEKDRIVHVAGDGRELYFQHVEPGASTRNDSEKLDLSRSEYDIRIRKGDLLTHVFAPAARPDGSWPLVRIEDPRGNRIEFQYDRRGRLDRVIDSAGRPIEFVTDESGRIETIRLPDPDDRTRPFDAIRFEYDQAGDLRSVYDALGHPFRYAYKNHLLVEETARNGLSFYFAYDGITPDSRCVRTWGTGGIFDHVLTYDTANKVTVKEVDPMGAALEIAYDSTGNITRMTDADGVGREYEYDGRGQPVWEKAGAGEYQHEYTPFGELADSTNPVGGGITQEFSDQGDLLKIRSRGGTEVDLSWDAQRNLVQVAVSGERGTGAAYDALGRCIRVHLSDGEVIEYELDKLGRTVTLVSSRTGSERFEYDPQGLLLRHIDPGGGELAYEYGNFNKVVALRSSSRGERRFEYDKEGDLVSIINEKGERYEIQRDTEGQITGEVDFSGRSVSYKLDAAGRLEEATEASGKTRKLSWTPGGRLAGIEYADGCFDTFTYDDTGRLTAAENEHGAISRTYDAAGRMISEDWADSSISYEYDLDDRRVSVASSDGYSAAYGYDDGDRLTSLRVNDRFDYRRRYSANGLVLSGDMPGGLTAKYRYDENGFPREQTVRGSTGETLAHRFYEFNAVGALAALYDDARGLKSYSFGPHGLEAVLRDGEVAERFRRDAAGELLPDIPEGAIAPGGRLLQFGDVSYDYDDDGRVVRKRKGAESSWEYVYNDRGQLVELVDPTGKTTVYEYDPFWRRTLKKTDTRETCWTWDGATPLTEKWVNDTDSGSRTFVFEPESFTPVAALENGKCQSFVVDHQGTPQEILSSSGDVLWAADFDAWGTVRRSRTAGFENPLRFPGQWHDDESGLHYNRFRHYDPDTGRYLTPDPIGLVGGLSHYGYVGDPLTFADPLGLGGCARRFFSSYMVFFRSGIRPRHARAIMRQAMETGETYAFRNIGTFRKRIGAFVAGIFGMRPKPMSTKAKSNGWGVATDPSTGSRYRSDYDPTYYRNADGSVMTNAEADAANRSLNNSIGGDEIQHPTHVTMPEDIAPQVGPPTNSTVFHPDGSTSQQTTDQIRDAEGMPWLWD